MARGGGVSSRGRGKFKVARGGGRHFSRDLDPRFNNAEESESSEEESSEEESDEEPNADDAAKLAPEMAALNLKLGNTVAIGEGDEEEMTRAERKAMKKSQAQKKVTIAEPEESGSESEEEAPKPAPAVKIQGKAKAKAAEPVQMSRKEREAADKKAAQARYQNLHAQGKTVEAKTDLARLQEVRARREAAAAQRKAEADERVMEAALKKEKMGSKGI